MNQHLIDLILYENENTNLDFKKVEYRKENYEEFLKDIISFANANSKGIKYIIIGRLKSLFLKKFSIIVR